MCVQKQKIDKSLKKIAAKLFEQGNGYKAVSTMLGVKQQTVRDWSYTWRALGTEGLLTDDRKHYSLETKLAVVRGRQEGMSVIEVMEKYQIHDRYRVKEWCKYYAENGSEAFCKRKGNEHE